MYLQPIYKNMKEVSQYSSVTCFILQYFYNKESKKQNITNIFIAKNVIVFSLFYHNGKE